jgi:predicted phage terminase large subunit-like protein
VLTQALPADGPIVDWFIQAGKKAYDKGKIDDAHRIGKRVKCTVDEVRKIGYISDSGSRSAPAKAGIIVVDFATGVARRVLDRHPTVCLQPQSSEWELHSLPAIAEFEETILLRNGHSHRRRFGEALSPEREPVHVLEALKLQIGSDAFSAQYQQAPVPPGGAMVKRHWVRRYGDEPPSPAEQLMTVQSWDTASKGGPDNDWSVCTTWILTRRKRWYLLDVWRRRVDYPGLKSAAQDLARRWNAQRVLVEDAGTGTALVQELREVIPGIIAVRPVGDKPSRMAVASAKFEAGQVFLPERANWLPDLDAELFAYPGGRHNDQCDSISQALCDGDRNMPMEITDEILAMASRPW